MSRLPILMKPVLAMGLLLAGAHGQRFDWAVNFGGSEAKSLAEITTADPRMAIAVWTADNPSSPGAKSVYVGRVPGAGGNFGLRAVIHSAGPDLQARSAAADPSGALYVLGEFRDSVSLGNLGVGAFRSGNSFLARLRADGSAAWIRRVASAARPYLTAGRMALDGQGNAVLTGEFEDSVRIGDSTFRAVEPGSFTHRMGTYLAKFDTAGNLLWATHYLAASSHPSQSIEWFAPDVAVNRAGEVFVTGNFRNVYEARFDSITIQGGQGAYSLYLAKYSSQGAVVWARILAGCTAYGDASALAIDSAGDILIGGHHQGILTLQDTLFDAGRTPSGSADQDMFLAKLDPQGQPLWVRWEGSDSPDALHDVAVDPEGNAHIAGRAWYIPEFRDSTYPAGSDSVYRARTFVRRYSQDGIPAWTKHVSEAGTRLSLVAFEDAVYLGSGVIQESEPILFDQVSLRSGNLRDIFMARISPKSKPSALRSRPETRKVAGGRRDGLGTPAYHLPPSGWSDALGRPVNRVPQVRP